MANEVVKALRNVGTADNPQFEQYFEETIAAAVLMEAGGSQNIKQYVDGKITDNKTTVDSALSDTSTNPVQNKAVKAALDKKSDTTHTHTPASIGAAAEEHKHTKSDIVDFPESMPASDVKAWAKADSKPTYTASEVGAIPTTSKGAANGVAELDSNGKVPAAQLPSFVDDVIEGTLTNTTTFKETGGTNTTPETGKIYVDTATGKTYRWSGSAFVEISASLALGETSSTAFAGDKGKEAYEHAKSTHAPTNAERNVIISIKKNGTALTPDSSRAVDISVPMKVSELSDAGDYAKTADVPTISFGTTPPSKAAPNSLFFMIAS